MDEEQIRRIQEMMAPVFGCKPEEIEVGEGYAIVKDQKLKSGDIHVWEITGG